MGQGVALAALIGIIGCMSVARSVAVACQAGDRGPHRWYGEVVCAIALAGSILAFEWACVGPGLIYQAQEPSFLLDWHVEGQSLSYPGGINELAGRFLAHLMYVPWLGAIALTCLLLAVAVLARMIAVLSGHRPFLVLYWIPSIVLLALHCDYGYPLGMSLGVVWVMVGLVIYLQLGHLRPAVKVVAFCLIQCLIYYIAAGQAFVLAGCVSVYELSKGRVWLGLIPAGLAAGIPYLLASTVFIIHLPDAYLDGLVRFEGYQVGWLSWLLYGSLAGLILLSKLRLDPRMPIQAAIVVAGAIAAAFLGHDAEAKRILLVDYHAARRDWDGLLQVAGTKTVNPVYIQYQLNRALFHQGRLLDQMFAFAQYRGRSLFLKGQLCALQPLAHSDIFMDLGLVNEAEHWAYEAAEIKGYTPRVISRLVEVNLLKGQSAMATKYLAMLSRTLWHSAAASRYARYIDDPDALRADPYLGPVARLMPSWDFLLAPDNPEFCLVELVKDPNNRMALEYYMAQCLLEGDLNGLARYLARFEQTGYTRIPRHIEEAMLIWLQIPGARVPLTRLEVSDRTIGRFNEFTQIMARHGGNRQAARRELMVYKDTYWFYWQYVLSEGKP